MKLISARHCIYLILFIQLWIIAGCKNPSAPGVETPEENFKPKGNLSDLVYNPVRRDGTIDSSYLPILKWDEVVYDFGTIYQGDVAQKNFTFTNTGTAPLLIVNATSTCGCTVPEWPKKPILPDSSGSVLVKFNSANKEGPQNKEVTIFANTIPNQSKINIKGNVEKTK